MQLVLLQRDVLKWVNLGELASAKQLPAEGAPLREKTAYRDFLLKKAGELEGQGFGNIATILHSIVNVQIDDGQVWDLKVHEDWIRDENWSGYRLNTAGNPADFEQQIKIRHDEILYGKDLVDALLNSGAAQCNYPNGNSITKRFN